MVDRRASGELVVELVSVLGAGPWSLDSVRRAGWSPARIRAAVKAGRLVRPRRGVLAVPYAEATQFGLASEAAIRAAVLVCSPAAVVSHESAAVLHDVWTPSPPSPWVHLTTSGRPDRRYRGVRCHESRLPTAAVVEIDGLRVTSLPRTGIDLARGRRLPEALVALDGVARATLHRHMSCDLESLRDPRVRSAARARVVESLLEAYQTVWSWPGSVVVRDALHLIDPASESPLESRSRGWMSEAGLPRPEIAYAVQGRSGRWYYADFAWPAQRVLGEADGLGKYGGDSATVTRRLREERARQRDLEDAGWTVVRWDGSEGARVVIARLRAALAR